MIGRAFRPAAAIAALGLVACAAPSFMPFTVEITDRAAFTADLAACPKYAAQYQQSLSVRRVAQTAAAGAVSNGPAAVINPAVGGVVIGLGAASSGASEIAGELGVIDLNVDKITAHCLHDKGQRSGAYLVIDPNL